jgi:hypothetical protein
MSSQGMGRDGAHLDPRRVGAEPMEELQLVAVRSHPIVLQ